MINGGVAGGSAEQGMERIEFDILAQKPDRVFICFGMNDVCYMLYAEENPDADNLAQRERAIADHRFYMEQCIGTLLKNNIKAFNRST
jgi:lysophospholipase L1-like esterase